jgi:hypothetical protein
MDPKPGAARDNIAVRNLFVKCDEVKSNRWVTNELQFVTADDPGFVNMQQRDFRLRPESPVFTRIPGFKPLPLEKMGLRRPARCAD